METRISKELSVMMESARTLKNAFENYKKLNVPNRDVFFDGLLSSNIEKNPKYLSVGVYWELKAL